MSSPYITLGNRPLEQWKVTELKEELKKRKLTTKGLKDDLLKRLDEAVRIELANAATVAADDDESDPPIEQENKESASSGKDKGPIDISVGVGEKLDAKPEHGNASSDVNIVVEAGVEGAKVASGLEGQPMETTVLIGESAEPVTKSSESNLHADGKSQDNSTAVVSDDGLLTLQENPKLELSDPNNQLPQISESMDTNPPTKQSIQGSVTQNEVMDSYVQLESNDSKSLQPDSSAHPLKYQVSEVNPDLGSQVTSDSVSTESVPIIEKNELKVDVITDDVKLELDAMHQMGQTSADMVDPDGGKLDPEGDEAPLSKDDIDEPFDKRVIEPVDKVVPTEVTSESNAENVDNIKSIDNVDLGPEKLSLDRSSGDDSMEEDVLDSKLTEYKFDSKKTYDDMEMSEKPVTNEDDHVDVVGHDKPVEMNAADSENQTVTQGLAKRKFHDKESPGHNDAAKKARRWNTHGSKDSEQQISIVAASVKPKGLAEPTFMRTVPDPVVSEDTPKERNVPPSSKPPTNSLRIDRFLRPFTLKAVQELLGKSGTVTSFWMDHIKTHCYVSYSSVEEAVETRNAVYNLQWPPNGGRMLVAEFVDPQEVKARLEAPPVTPTTPSASAAAAAKPQVTVPPQPSPRQHLPPPPQLSNPPFSKEHLHPPREPLPREQPLAARDRLNLPPPPPIPEKVDPPIVTLDDLFRKTKAMPRIYYLPLSDEQVAAKLKSQGKNVNQSAGVACRMMFQCCWCCFSGGFLFLFDGLHWAVAESMSECILLPPSLRLSFQLKCCYSGLDWVSQFSQPQTLLFYLVDEDLLRTSVIM